MSDVGGTSVPASFWTNALRRQAFLVVVLAVICAGAGVAFAVVRGVQYSATASILIDPLEGNPYAPDGREQLVNLETEAALVSTDPVAKLAEKKLGHPVSLEQRNQIEVEVPTNTQVLEISCTAGDRDPARACAQAFADSYLTYRAMRARGGLDSELGRVRRQKDSIRTTLNQAEADLRADDITQARKTSLEGKIASLSSRLSGLEIQENTLQATDLRPGQLITPASTPPASVTRLGLYGAGGLGFGLLLGFVIAIARARADDRIHASADVQQLGVPVLGSARDRFGSKAAGMATAPGRVPELPEAYREFRTAVVTSADEPPICLALLSASPGITTAPEAAGLATGLARAGFRVTVVDTLGETTWLLGGRGRLRGLGELLVEGAELDRLLVQPEDRLTVLPLGRAHTHTMDRLLSPQMRRAVQVLIAQSDYVVIAGGTADGADGRALASLAGAVVLVANQHVTTRERLASSADAVRRVDADLLGAIVVDAGPPPGPAKRALKFLLSPLTPRRRTVRPPDTAPERSVSDDSTLVM